MDISGNDRLVLRAELEHGGVQGLGPEEVGILTRYTEQMEREGHLDGRSIRDITGINEVALGREFLGGGTLEQTETELYIEGHEIPRLIGTRPYLFLADRTGQHFALIRNKDLTATHYAVECEMFDLRSHTWVDVTEEQLDEMFPEKDSFVGMTPVSETGKRAEHDQVNHHYEHDTLGSQVRGGKYYCEKQKSAFCQIHAANAFLGYRAVVPSELQAFVTMRSHGMSGEHVQGLARGGEADDATCARAEGPDASELMDIEGGVDQGMVLAFLQNLHETGELNVDVSNLRVGKLTFDYDRRELVFLDDSAGDDGDLRSEVVDDAFCQRFQRSMVGTFAPIHATARRRNADGSWTEVDSLYKRQPVYESLADHYRALFFEQTGRTGEEPDDEVAKMKHMTLPVAFL